MSVRFKIALTIFLTGLLTAAGVVATVLFAFQRFEHESTYYRASAFLDRVVTSPDGAYQRYTQALVAEGCEGFACVHNAMTPAHRLRAAQSLKGYEQDFLLLAAR